MVGRTETVLASFYDDPRTDKDNPNIMTSSGERFDPRSDSTVASPVYPNGTRLLLWNPRTRAAAEVRVTNSGPYHGARKLDVSARAAEKLGFRPFGVSQLSVTVLSAPTNEDAKYLKGRKYAPVAGYIGVFESQDRAQMAFASLAPSLARPAAPLSSGAPVAAAAPLHTGSVGWTTSLRPARPPLRRSGVLVADVPPAPSAAAATGKVAATPESARLSSAPLRPGLPAIWSATLARPEGVVTPGEASAQGRSLGLR